MASNVRSPLDLSDVPSELIRAVADGADRDANLVVQFLEALSQTPAGSLLAKRPLHLPADFLLRLGASLRLFCWEQSGIAIHRRMGLPSARQALRNVFQSLADPQVAAQADDVCLWVVVLSTEAFAWAGRAELDAELLLGDMDEDSLVDALAEFLWTHRHALSDPREIPGDQP